MIRGRLINVRRHMTGIFYALNKISNRTFDTCISSICPGAFLLSVFP